MTGGHLMQEEHFVQARRAFCLQSRLLGSGREEHAIGIAITRQENSRAGLLRNVRAWTLSVFFELTL